MYSHLLKVESGIVLGDAAPLTLAAEIFYPAVRQFEAHPVVFFCLPGGAMNRHYFNLQTPEDSSFSFARAMAARGMVTVSIDHPGLGASDHPEDGFLLTPEVIAQADGQIIERIITDLRAGTLLPDLPPLPGLVSIGVGHSMGGLITILQHAAKPMHKALVLLGFSDNGLYQHLPEPVKALVGEPEKIRTELGQITRGLYPMAYPGLASSPEVKEMFYGARAEPAGAEALRRARDVLLIVAGLRSMIPGGVTEEMAQIKVPVFLGLGSHDIAGAPHMIPASLPNAGDVTLLVLEETGHSQFIFPSRARLFRRIAEWSRNMAAYPQ